MSGFRTKSKQTYIFPSIYISIYLSISNYRIPTPYRRWRRRRWSLATSRQTYIFTSIYLTICLPIYYISYPPHVKSRQTYIFISICPTMCLPVYDISYPPHAWLQVGRHLSIYLSIHPSLTIEYQPHPIFQVAATSSVSADE